LTVALVVLTAICDRTARRFEPAWQITSARKIAACVCAALNQRRTFGEISHDRKQNRGWPWALRATPGERLSVTIRSSSVAQWGPGSRFIISRSLLIEVDYVAGLRDVLGVFRSRALFVLDEAHHARVIQEARAMRFRASSRAPCATSPSGSSTACSSPRRRTTGIPTASRLLEMLDPQRFTRLDQRVRRGCEFLHICLEMPQSSRIDWAREWFGGCPFFAGLGSELINFW
jgi:hypothetical protein